MGTAEGLYYLHEGCQRRIIHKDIKASNILLTQNFEAQVMIIRIGSYKIFIPYLTVFDDYELRMNSRSYPFFSSK